MCVWNGNFNVHWFLALNCLNLCRSDNKIRIIWVVFSLSCHTQHSITHSIYSQLLPWIQMNDMAKVIVVRIICVFHASIDTAYSINSFCPLDRCSILQRGLLYLSNATAFSSKQFLSLSTYITFSTNSFVSFHVHSLH